MSADRTPGLPTRGALVPRRRRTPLGGPSGDFGGRAKTLAGCTRTRRAGPAVCPGPPRTVPSPWPRRVVARGRSRRRRAHGLLTVISQGPPAYWRRGATPTSSSVPRVPHGIGASGGQEGGQEGGLPDARFPSARAPLVEGGAHPGTSACAAVRRARTGRTVAREPHVRSEPALDNSTTDTSCYKATAGAFGGRRRPGRRHRVPAGHSARHPHPARRRIRRPPPVRGGPCLLRVMPRRHAARLTDNRITPQGR